MEVLKGWRSILVGVLLALAGILEKIDWASVLPEDSGTVATIAGVVIVVLRFLTTSAVGQKK